MRKIYDGFLRKISRRGRMSFVVTQNALLLFKNEQKMVG